MWLHMLYNLCSLSSANSVPKLSFIPQSNNSLIQVDVVPAVKSLILMDNNYGSNRANVKDNWHGLSKRQNTFTLTDALLKSKNQHIGISRQFRADLSLYWKCIVWAMSVIWLLELLHNMTLFVISLATAMWYFTIVSISCSVCVCLIVSLSQPDIQGKRDDISLSASGSAWVTLRYHLGTLFVSASILPAFR